MMTNIHVYEKKKQARVDEQPLIVYIVYQYPFIDQ